MNDTNERSVGSAGSVDAPDWDANGDPLPAGAVKLLRIAGLEAENARLRAAATALYRHRWACDDLQPGEQAALWESMRDAIGLPPGTATSMGVQG